MNSLAPIFTAVFGFIMLGEGLSMARIGAFSAWFIRVAVLVGIGPYRCNALGHRRCIGRHGRRFVCYGFAATYTRMFAKDIPALARATGPTRRRLALLPFAAPGVPTRNQPRHRSGLDRRRHPRCRVHRHRVCHVLPTDFHRRREQSRHRHLLDPVPQRRFGRRFSSMKRSRTASSSVSPSFCVQLLCLWD